LYAFGVQTLNVRMTNMVAWRKDANKQKRQSNKNLKQQGVQLSRSLSANANLRETRMAECKDEAEAVRFAVIFRSSFSYRSTNPIFLCCSRIFPELKSSNLRKGMSRAYEDYVRSCMATGCSARHIRDIQLLTFGFLLDVNEGTKLKGQVPAINWFAQQREAMGMASYVYAFLAVAGCDEIVQWGFDETTLDGSSCFNQWCLLRKDKVVTLVTLECAGVLPSSTAEETIEHIAATWERGKQVVDMLRNHLGPDLQNVHCPVVNGGVELHKIFGLMHDTCNTANRVAELMATLRDDSGRKYFGEDTWDAEGNKVARIL
jgi:hypothetical protein